MVTVITEMRIIGMRFPTSGSLDGSHAMGLGAPGFAEIKNGAPREYEHKPLPGTAVA